MNYPGTHATLLSLVKLNAPSLPDPQRQLLVARLESVLKEFLSNQQNLNLWLDRRNAYLGHKP